MVPLKKGDLRKQDIINTAEAMFCKNGYEQTSIQDILNQIKGSKGSFYHHFESKEMLLEEICRKRAEQIYAMTASNLDESSNAVSNLNLLISGMVPFRDVKLSFLLMLLPVFRLPEGRMLKQGFCESLSGQFMPDVVRELEKGHKAGELYCPEPELSAELILSVVNMLWVKICDIIIVNETKDSENDLTLYQQITDYYRLTVEKIVLLPCGSIEIISLPMLKNLIEQINSHWAY